MVNEIFKEGDYILIEDLPKPAIIEKVGVAFKDDLLISFPHIKVKAPGYESLLASLGDFENVCKISEEFAKLLQRFSDEELLKFHQNFLIRPKKEVTWEEFVKNKYWRKYGKDPYA